MKREIREQAIVKLNRKPTSKKERTSWKKIFLLAILISGFLGWSQGLEAQEYPKRPITLLINMAAGGSSDVCGRMIAEGAKKILGQEIIPVNKPGGGGSVATGILANSEGDGYTLMAGPWASLTTVPHLSSVPYDPLKDIIPIIQYGVLYNAIMVRSDSPHNSLKDLIEFARKNPGKVSFANPGIGTSSHLATDYLITRENLNIPLVPFSGGVPAWTAFLGGHVTACTLGQSVFLGYLKAEKAKLLASTADKRMKDIQDVPTLLELGYPNSAFMERYIIAAPKGTPPAVIEKLEDTFRKVMKTQEYRNLGEDKYHTYVEDPLSGKDLKASIENAYARDGEIIRKAKLGK